MVRWQDRSGLTRLAAGKSKNISHSGAFILCDSLIGEGCSIDLRIDLPINVGGFITSRISASAKVVRNESEPGTTTGYGHGIAFQDFDFKRIPGI